MDQQTEIKMELSDLINTSRAALEAYEKSSNSEYDYTILYRRMAGAQKLVSSIKEKAHASAYVLKEELKRQE